MYPAPQSSALRFRFDAFEVDGQTSELWKNGQPVPLQEVPCRFLVALLERPGELVTREELRERIWPKNVNLDFDGALGTAVRKVRIALGDATDSPTYVETLPGKGYRFLRGVAISSSNGLVLPESPAPAREGVTQERIIWLRTARSKGPPEILGSRSHLLPAGFLLALALAAGLFLVRPPWQARKQAAGTAQRPSVLALPADVNGAADQAFLTDAFPATLSTLLAETDGLDVRLPPTRLEVEKVKGDIGKIAQLYGVEHLLLTTVTARDAWLVFDLRLVDADTREIRWARQLEGHRNDYLKLVGGAASTLKDVLRPGGSQLSAIPPGRSEIELCLAEGRYFSRRYGQLGLEQDFSLALSALQRVEALDPMGPLPLAEMAKLFNDKYWLTRAPEASQAAQSYANKALEKDARCGMAWMVRSWMETNRSQNDPERAVEYAVRAVCCDPRDPRIHQGLGTVVAGSNGIFTATGRKSMELDPLDIGGYSWAAAGLIWNGRAEEALPIVDRALRIEPGSGFHRFLKLQALVKLGRLEEAQRVDVSGKGQGYYGARILSAILNEEIPEARKHAAKHLVAWRGPEPSVSMDWANRAIFFAPLLVRLDMNEDALWLLQKSAESRNPPPFDWLLIDGDLQHLVGDPRFTNVLSKSRDYARVCIKHLDEARARGELPSYLEQPLEDLRTLLNRPQLN